MPQPHTPTPLSTVQEHRGQEKNENKLVIYGSGHESKVEPGEKRQQRRRWLSLCIRLSLLLSADLEKFLRKRRVFKKCTEESKERKWQEKESRENLRESPLWLESFEYTGYKELMISPKL